MNDQVGVGVTDGRKRVENQPQPVSDAQTMRVGGHVNRLPVDEFEDEIRLTPRAHAGIEQAARYSDVKGARARYPRAGIAPGPWNRAGPD